jgi:hypothetical protein
LFLTLPLRESTVSLFFPSLTPLMSSDISLTDVVLGSAEWVQGDARRTAVGLDLDVEALHWGLQHNLLKASGDAHRRVTLYQGDVRFPISRAKLIAAAAAAHCCSHSLSDAFEKQTSLISEEEEGDEEDGEDDNDHDEEGNEEVTQAVAAGAGAGAAAADIVCAFNYSCCCLHTRNDLVLYFQQVRQTLTDEGGIFAMDLYGGTSSECALKLRRRFENFMVKYSMVMHRSFVKRSMWMDVDLNT